MEEEERNSELSFLVRQILETKFCRDSQNQSDKFENDSIEMVGRWKEKSRTVQEKLFFLDRNQILIFFSKWLWLRRHSAAFEKIPFENPERWKKWTDSKSFWKFAIKKIAFTRGGKEWRKMWGKKLWKNLEKSVTIFDPCQRKFSQKIFPELQNRQFLKHKMKLKKNNPFFKWLVYISVFCQYKKKESLKTWFFDFLKIKLKFLSVFLIYFSKVKKKNWNPVKGFLSKNCQID